MDIPVLAPAAEIQLGISDPLHVRVEEMIGNGGSGVVYRVTSPRHAFPLVVKIAREMPVGTSLLTEARWTPRPSPDHFCYEFLGFHPAFLPGMDAGVPVPATLARWYPNATVAHWVSEHGAAKRKLALRWVVEIATTLRHAQVLHRDIKPNNIFLDQENHAWLGDYGLAVPAEPAERQRLGIRLRPDFIVGTMEYMSPESLRIPAEIDVRSDIYSLGLVIFELATGVPARLKRQEGEDPHEYIMELRNLAFLVDTNRIKDGVLRRICERCVLTHRSKRYQSYDELIADAVPYADLT